MNSCGCYGNQTLGLIAALPETDELSTSIYSSCVKLIQHIASQGQAYFTKEKDQASSREVCVCVCVCVCVFYLCVCFLLVCVCMSVLLLCMCVFIGICVCMCICVCVCLCQCASQWNQAEECGTICWCLAKCLMCFFLGCAVDDVRLQVREPDVGGHGIPAG